MHAARRLRFALLLTLPACSCPDFRAERTEQLSISTDAVSRVHVRTHNGGIVLRPGEPGVVKGTAVIETRAGDQERANAMLQEVAVFGRVEQDAVAVGFEREDWWARCESSSVTFELEVPPSWAIDIGSHNGALVAESVGHGGARARTHNGAVRVLGAQGEIEIETHNGGVQAKNVSGTLRGSSHNGGFALQGDFERLEVTTHNGGIGVQYAGEGPASGRLSTHNGAIHVALGHRDAEVLMRGRSRRSYELAGRGHAVRSGDRTTELQVGGVPAIGTRLEMSTHNGGLHVSAEPGGKTAGETSR